jgi:hypothetical protein
MEQTTGSIRKRLLPQSTPEHSAAPGEIDLKTAATISYSSEAPGHPIDSVIDGSTGQDGTRWVSARPNSTETVLIEFDQPQSVSRIIYEVVERENARTQEVRIDASQDLGHTYRQILVQEYSFSPTGAVFEREDLRFELREVSHLRFSIVPNKNGSGLATLSSVRVFN